MIKKNARGEQRISQKFMEFAEKYEERYRLDSKIDEKLQKFEVDGSDQQRLRKFAGFVGGRRCLLFEERLGAMLITSTTSHRRQRRQVCRGVIGIQHR